MRRALSVAAVVFALPLALAGCPALLSDWTISGNGTDGASADAPSPDATAGGASSGGSSSGSSSSSSGGADASWDDADDGPAPEADSASSLMAPDAAASDAGATTNTSDASATDASCGTACPANSTCIYEVAPVDNEGQTCGVSCASATTIATIADVYANNCNPTPCPGPLAGCQSSSGCTVNLENSTCGLTAFVSGDPCPDVEKGWSVTITCN
jgi:hypothetical protein